MSLDIRDYNHFLYQARQHHHAGISKIERLAQLQGSRSWFYDKKRHVHHQTTYGMKGHFGGWCGFAGKTQRHRMVRMWRKQARRENKRWIQEKRDEGEMDIHRSQSKTWRSCEKR